MTEISISINSQSKYSCISKLSWRISIPYLSLGRPKLSCVCPGGRAKPSTLDYDEERRLRRDFSMKLNANHN